MKRKLSQHVIETAKKPGIIWDTECPHLGICVFPSGQRSFIFYYRRNKKLTKLTIGQHPGIMLANARRIGHMYNTQLALGDDLATRDKQASTFGDLADDFIARHASKKKTGYHDRRRIEKHLRPVWGRKHVDKIKRPDMRDVHERIGRTAPYEANRVLSLVSKIYSFAIEEGYLPDTAANPAKRIPKYKEEKRDRWVTAVDLPVLANSINAENDPRIRAGLWLYLLTGLRNRELMRLKWTDYDPDQRMLKLPDTKPGRVFYLPLSTAAVEMLESIPRDPHSPWIFPGPGPSGHWLEFPRQQWYRIRKRAGMPDLRIHDLRRTAGSWLASSGESLILVGKALNQSTLSTTEVYAHLAQDPLREALEKHGSKIISFADIKSREAVEG